MADTPFPLPTSLRQTDVLVGDGRTTYGPFGAGWGIFDDDDVTVKVWPAQVAFAVGKVALSEKYSAFTITFARALTAADTYQVKGKRRHRRELAVTRGGAIDGVALELELSKQAVVLQEQTRDIGDIFTNKADLVNGKVPASQLNVAWKFVVAIASLALLPLEGAAETLYVVNNPQKEFIWSNDRYVNVSESTGLGDHLTDANPHTQYQLITNGAFPVRSRAELNAANLPALFTQVQNIRTGTRWFRLLAVPGLLSYKQTTSNGGTVAWEADVDILDFAALGVKGDDTDEGSHIADICNSIPTMQVTQFYKPTAIVLQAGRRYYAPNGQFHLFQNHVQVHGNGAMVRANAFPAITVSHNNSVNIPTHCRVSNVWMCNNPASGSGNPAFLGLTPGFVSVEHCIIAPPDVAPGGSVRACSGPAIEFKGCTSPRAFKNIILSPGNHGIYHHAGRKDYVGPATVYGGGTRLEASQNYIAHCNGIGIWSRQSIGDNICENVIEVCSSGSIKIDRTTDFTVAFNYEEVCGTFLNIGDTANEFPGFVADTTVKAGLVFGNHSSSTNGVLCGTTGAPENIIIESNWFSGVCQVYAGALNCVWGRQRVQFGAVNILSSSTIREDDLYATATLDIASLAAGATREEANVTCVGAVVGDFVEVLQSGDLLGVTMTARVSAANIITPRSTNPTLAAVDPASMSFKYRVKKA